MKGTNCFSIKHMNQGIYSRGVLYLSLIVLEDSISISYIMGTILILL